MALNTALSGLDASQAAMNTVANDLSNANTNGFKSQTALFGDIYPPNAIDAPGQGVVQSSMDNNFSEGNLQTTGNPLDLAIQGNGFFLVNQNGTQLYTRDGAFQLNPSGNLVTSNGANVLGYSLNTSGVASGTVQPINVNTASQPAKATQNVGLATSLNSGDPVITAAFNPSNPATYDQSTSVTAYDSLGNANTINLYYVQNPPSSTPSTWTIYAQPVSSSGSAVGSATALTTLSFNSNGQLASGGTASLTGVNWGNGSAVQPINFNMTGTTLGNQAFAIDSTTNDGYAPGSFTGASVTKTGDIQATYSNGQTQTIGQIAMASFINNQGLIPTSGNLYAASNTSGLPDINPPNVGVNGSVVSGSLEQSNVSTSDLLVQLIKTQQDYQANSSVIQTDQQDVTRLIQVA